MNNPIFSLHIMIQVNIYVLEKLDQSVMNWEWS